MFFEYFGSPIWRDGTHEFQRRSVFVLHSHCGFHQIAIGFVYNDQMTVLHDATLQSLLKNSRESWGFLININNIRK